MYIGKTTPPHTTNSRVIQGHAFGVLRSLKNRRGAVYPEYRPDILDIMSKVSTENAQISIVNNPTVI